MVPVSAHNHGESRTTFQDKLSGRVIHGTIPTLLKQEQRRSRFGRVLEVVSDVGN